MQASRCILQINTYLNEKRRHLNKLGSEAKEHWKLYISDPFKAQMHNTNVSSRYANRGRTHKFKPNSGNQTPIRSELRKYISTKGKIQALNQRRKHSRF